MDKKYFMEDQIRRDERITFPGRALKLMSSGIFFSAIIAGSVSLFYIN